MEPIDPGSPLLRGGWGLRRRFSLDTHRRGPEYSSPSRSPQSGGPIATPWAAQVQGILENWFPGQVDGDAIAPVLFGDVDPSGKLPVTFPVKLSDDPLRLRSPADWRITRTTRE